MPEKGLIAKIIVRFILGLISIGAILFSTAGTLNWLEAWIYIVIQFGWSAGLTVWLWNYDPELLKDRLKFMKKSAKGWDKVLTFVSMPFYAAYLLIPGFDAVRYQWSHVPVGVKVLCFILIVASFLWITWVMKENTYLSRFVEIQEERGHKVITSGPYRFVRHPMYIGAAILLLALPVALGSLYALVPTAFALVFMIIRTVLEDKTLHKELEGYVEYAQKTKYRLIPGIW
ncbi:MAG: isoprenylcysteine carboxylmethyltransferase family protein [Candidatus Aminicenantes bacterium]|nr:MAG: isoprenylcysteine carboxylmethyltransferase family protein [Candidatus Aminicenantes bacterium]